jgi:hypothetical protein
MTSEHPPRAGAGVVLADDFAPLRAPVAQLPPELERIATLLAQWPGGVGEYELLEALRGEAPLAALDSLGLFKVHFLLFHHLYRLRQWLEGAGVGTLLIHCLEIRLVRLAPRPSLDLARPDPLAAYYLDLRELERATEESVLELLASFWVRYGAWGHRAEALAALGLSEGVTTAEIRGRYRELCLLHHPDRGGDPQEFLRIAGAMERLRDAPGET